MESRATGEMIDGSSAFGDVTDSGMIVADLQAWSLQWPQSSL
jgi:hypothetical protein